MLLGDAAALGGRDEAAPPAPAAGPACERAHAARRAWGFTDLYGGGAARSLRLWGSCAWPATVVLVECLQGHAGRDAVANEFLKTCEVAPTVSEKLARRAAVLRRLARCGSAVDALVVASAEPGGTVITTDPKDLEALAAHAQGVDVVAV